MNVNHKIQTHIKAYLYLDFHLHVTSPVLPNDHVGYIAITSIRNAMLNTYVQMVSLKWQVATQVTLHFLKCL